jgi:hypothetical protein
MHDQQNVKIITFSECVFVALVIQHAERMRPIILPSVAFFLHYVLLHYLINDTIFGTKKEREKKKKMDVLILSTNFFETFLIPKTNERDITINLSGLHVKYL